MRIIADLHIHSLYARACSKAISIPNLSKYARMKGVGLLGTGDFTHPKWLAHLKENLTEEEGTGILRDKSDFPYVMQVEVANIYSDGGPRVRKVHNVILAPGMEVAEQINSFLGKKGNLSADGRPIFGKMTCAEMVEELMSISRDIMVIPAHAWTPWFGVFGSMSGFDSLEECFKDQTKHIHAIETGLSSDPPMNWRIKGLDKIALVSSSDLHSFWPWRMGREANIFDLKGPNYFEIVKAIREKDPKKFLGTIEVDPSYGKYHYDGHRSCKVSMGPKETAKLRGICPSCKKPMTIGVMSRVEELADRPEGFKLEGALPYHSLVPLSEIIALSERTSSMASKKVWELHSKFMKLGDEFSVLLDKPREELSRVDERIADYIIKLRAGEVEIIPGYDGVYGKLVFSKDKETERKRQEAKEKLKNVPKQKSPGCLGNLGKAAQQKSLGDF